MGALFVFGAGGHGKVVADVARSAGWNVIGFIDDAPGRTDVGGVTVFPWARFLSSRDGASVALGIGDNAARQRVRARLAAERIPIATLVHARAVVAGSAKLGEGTVVMALAAVNPDAVVEAGAILNTGCVVEHDCVLGEYVHLSPNSALGGGVTIGAGTHLGLGAVVLPGLKVGSSVRVGAGAVVTRDVPDGVTVVGVPARATPG